ncbi:LuxR C-terminal-related transcriptional regulator [Variovorax sp. RA8]|uniref:LuxR C-terminal-related transcriptional regulator n=1 Tax=Variovorax sp. (strain JCM 16519 / RA8) TaxID=662548 RepID=UPI001317A419|nr:LuxR C-terminal-related transcriptional regulator [Variovorax sp. RA8]VTU24893.1 ATP-dependent transcriptional activator MalT [Variovorax sp. RA8]
MQSASLARAKIQTPRFRSGLIERSELEQQLGDALASRRLVLLVAPAGYGKTAALSRQLQRLPAGCAVAWLTADEDDDLQRLLAHLIEALEPLDPPWRLAPEALLALVDQGRLREAAPALLNTLEATDTPNGGVLVLDDLHAIADARVFEFLNQLLEGLPQNWTLVISSRVEPPLALARWRARRELAEFDEAALSFSMKEVQELWRHATGADDPEQARHLHERTQGWAAGLSLSLEASEHSAITAPKGIRLSNRHLFDYLASEVLEQLPGELQAFLLRCSVLPELTVPRCRQISGNPRAAELLEDVGRRRLFSSVLDGEELTLRLHDLFRDFLEERLRQVYPEEVPALLRRAAQGEPDPLRRTLTYLRAGAWEESEQSLADAMADMLADDRSAQIIRIIEQFPADIQARSPLLAYARGLCAWPRYQYATVRSNMEHAAAGFDAAGRHGDAQRARAAQAMAEFFCGNVDDALRLSQAVRKQPMDLETEVLGELLAFWHEAQNGPVDGPGRHLAKMVDLLTRRGSAELWFRCMPRINMHISRPGVSTQIQRLVDGAREATGDRNWSLQSTADMLEAWLLLWQGRAAEMEAALQRIEEDTHWLGQPAGLRIRLLSLNAMYQVICDDKEAVRATCDAIVAQAASLRQCGDLSVTFLAIAVRNSAVIGDWPTVRRYLPELQADAGKENPCMQMFIRALEAHLAFQEGRVAEARATLRALVTRTAMLDTNCLDAMVRTRLALAELADGAPAAAWRALEPLIERVETSGNVGQVLVMGAQSLGELSLASWDGAAPAEGLAALRRWIEIARRFKAGVQKAPASAPQQNAGLSARELQVLALLAYGQSNKLIARALDLSPHTVKRHVARILDRLDLASRMQAADWYRARFPS